MLTAPSFQSPGTGTTSCSVFGQLLVTVCGQSSNTFRGESQEWALFVFKMILVLHSLSCFSLCFLWPCLILLASYRGQGGTCPHTLHSVFSHSQTLYWLVLSVAAPQTPCQSSLVVFCFCLMQAHKTLLWNVSPHLLWPVSLNADLPSVFSVCARSATQLEWCSAFGWWWFLSLCLFLFFPERNSKDAEAVGNMKKMQMISTSRPAWHLLLSSWRQSGIKDSGCCCSNINIFPVWTRGEKKCTHRVLKATSSLGCLNCHFWVYICYTWVWALDR